MALLRESSRAAGHDLDAVAALTDPESDAGVPGGRLLRRFATEATARTGGLGDARAALEAAVGEAGVRQAAMTIGAFSGLVRVADGTGIQVDDMAFALTTRERAALAIDGYGGATNTRVDATSVATPDHFENAYELFR